MSLKDGLTKMGAYEVRLKIQKSIASVKSTRDTDDRRQAKKKKKKERERQKRQFKGGYPGVVRPAYRPANTRRTPHVPLLLAQSKVPII